MERRLLRHVSRASKGFSDTLHLICNVKDVSTLESQKNSQHIPLLLGDGIWACECLFALILCMLPRFVKTSLWGSHLALSCRLLLWILVKSNGKTFDVWPRPRWTDSDLITGKATIINCGLFLGQMYRLCAAGHSILLYTIWKLFCRNLSRGT